VDGYDVSPSLIEYARGRSQAEQCAIAFKVADMATTFPAQPYQRLVSRFSVMFFADPRAAFANLLSWLEPGGRFAFAVWGRPSENPWMSSVREVVARIVEVPSLDLEAPGAFRYAEANKLLSLLTGVGFAHLDVADWRGALPIGGGLPPAAAAHFALAAFSSFGELLAKAGEETVQEARHSLTARFSQHQQDGVVWMDACVHLFTGARR
jgi:SAM-dependent methyltransferase